MKISVRREGSVDALVGRVHREADIGFVWKRRILWEIIQTDVGLEEVLATLSGSDIRLRDSALAVIIEG
jgi:hypothetical protein